MFRGGRGGDRGWRGGNQPFRGGPPFRGGRGGAFGPRGGGNFAPRPDFGGHRSDYDFGPQSDFGPRNDFGPRSNFHSRGENGPGQGFGPRGNFRPRPDFGSRGFGNNTNFRGPRPDGFRPRDREPPNWGNNRRGGFQGPDPRQEPSYQGEHQEYPPMEPEQTFPPREDNFNSLPGRVHNSRPFRDGFEPGAPNQSHQESEFSPQNAPNRGNTEPVKPSRWGKPTDSGPSSVSLPGPTPATIKLKANNEQQQPSLEVSNPSYETFPSTSKAIAPTPVLPQADLPRPIPSQDLVVEERKPRQPALPNEDEPNYDDSLVILDWYNSDLNLIIDKNDYCSAVAMSHEGFGLMWAGARATYGVCRGRACFEVRIDGNCNTQHLENEPTPNVLRVGWSLDEASMQLGEEPFSYGYGGTGKKAVGCTFTNYGMPFGVGDVVACYVDFTCEPVQIGYTLNGHNLGPAFHVTQLDLQGRALFPHVLTKNQNFTVNFGQLPAPMSGLLPDYPPIGQLDVSEGLVRGALAPSSRSDCEVLLMIGLPGAGKTFWATEHSKNYPKKRYQILGTNNLLERMKVQGLPRKRNYHGRWDVLISKCTRCFDELLKIATKRRRNYILDQTNVFPTARSRKFKDFNGFTRKAIVVVPENAEYLRRVSVREMAEGKEVPDDAVLSMKANFVLPDIEETYFDEVLYTELAPKDAQILVHQYNEEARRRGVEMTQSVKCFIQRNKDKRQTMGISEIIGRPIKSTTEQCSIIKPTGVPANGPPAPIITKELRNQSENERNRQTDKPATRDRKSKSRDRKRSRSKDRRDRKRTRSGSKSRDHRRRERTRSRDRSTRRRTRSPVQSARPPFPSTNNSTFPSPWAQNQAGPMGDPHFNTANRDHRHQPPLEGILGSGPPGQMNVSSRPYQPRNLDPNDPTLRPMEADYYRRAPNQFSHQPTQSDRPPGPFQQYAGQQQARFNQDMPPRDRQDLDNPGRFDPGRQGPSHGNMGRNPPFEPGPSDHSQTQPPFHSGRPDIGGEQRFGPIGISSDGGPQDLNRSSQFDARDRNAAPQRGTLNQNVNPFHGNHYDRAEPGRPIQTRGSSFEPLPTDPRIGGFSGQSAFGQGPESVESSGSGMHSFGGNEAFQGGPRQRWNNDQSSFPESERYGNRPDPRTNAMEAKPRTSSRLPQNSRWEQGNFGNRSNWNDNNLDSRYQNNATNEGSMAESDPRLQGQVQKPWNRGFNSEPNNQLLTWQQRGNNHNPGLTGPNARDCPPYDTPHQRTGSRLDGTRPMDGQSRNWNQSDGPQPNLSRPFEGQGPNWNHGQGPRPFEDPRDNSGRKMSEPARNPQNRNWDNNSSEFHEPTPNARNEWNLANNPTNQEAWKQNEETNINWNRPRDSRAPNWSQKGQVSNWNQSVGSSGGPENPLGTNFNATPNAPNSPDKSDSASSSRSNEGPEGETSTGPAPDYKALLNYLQFYQKQMGGNSKDGTLQ